MVVELVKAGFTVSFNRKGRLFRLQWEHGDTDGLHLDVRPVWFQDGRVWLHNHCSFPARREDFLPAAERPFRGTTVRVPREAIGRRAAQMILERVEGHAVADPVVDVGFEIMARESA